MPILGLACFAFLIRDGSFVVTGKMSFVCGSKRSRVDPNGVESVISSRSLCRIKVLIQHAPGLDGCGLGECREVSDAHDDVSELAEQLSLQRLCKEVGNHDAGRTVDKVDFSTGDSIFDKKNSGYECDAIVVRWKRCHFVPCSWHWCCLGRGHFHR